jgi:hypothetical protein
MLSDFEIHPEEFKKVFFIYERRCQDRYQKHVNTSERINQVTPFLRMSIQASVPQG